MQAAEYGFWANVNPEVPHPRWSQATEEVIGTGERKPTLLFNGYGEFVADLYKGIGKRALVGVSLFRCSQFVPISQGTLWRFSCAHSSLVSSPVSLA